ncbi:hypothetical protein RclHR1_00630005 [Rhizophagus clarus]|nr:hypothetical protein RclHR1_00630005 [Rhizophagus clarus]
MINMNRPIIKVPFPPVIDPRNLIVKTKDGRIPSRAPNAYIIYHKIFIETARNDGYHLPITVISSMSSQSWVQESDVVKAEYKRLAKEAYEVRNEMLPKSQRKRKREKWNIITFEKKSTRKGPALKTQKPAKEIDNLTTELNQFPSPLPSQTIRQVIPQFPQFPQSETFSETNQKFDQFIFQHMTSPVPNVPGSIEEKIVNSADLINFNNNQLLPSPDLSNISSPEINDFNFESLSESFSDINESSPIITEEELFDLLEPINEDFHTSAYSTYEGLGISDSIEFIPTSTLPNNSEETLFSHEMLDIYAFNEINNANSATVITEPYCGLNFDYPYYL